ncbi:hypothetical protein [Bradyrhizobium sp. USDA 4451]
MSEIVSRAVEKFRLPEFLLTFTPTHLYNFPHPARQEGRIAIVTNVRRDAMDAGGANDDAR